MPGNKVCFISSVHHRRAWIRRQVNSVKQIGRLTPQRKMKIVYMICMCSLLIDVKGSPVIWQTIKYRNVEEGPDLFSRIGTVTDTENVQMCLISCSKTTNCQSVLYEDGSCHLHNTTMASATLTSGQQAIIVVSKSTAYGKSDTR